jgi:hypothetical protein
MSEHLAVGGCRCGAVRVRARRQATDVIYCHCSDCRRSSGAPRSSLVTGQSRWTTSGGCRSFTNPRQAAAGLSVAIAGHRSPIRKSGCRGRSTCRWECSTTRRRTSPRCTNGSPRGSGGWTYAMVCRVTRGVASLGNTSRRCGGVAIGSAKIYAIISRRFWSEASFSRRSTPE